MLTSEEESSAWMQEVIRLLTDGQKIAAIKLYRERHHVDLKTAKQDVEAIAVQNGLPASSGSGCLGVVLAGLVCAAWWFRSH